MKGKLEKFEIKGLFGKYDVKIPFNRESLILVGENGTGKSTVANSIYYTLSCQWGRLVELEFEQIGVTLEEKSIHLGYDDIGDLYRRHKERREHRLPPSLREKARAYIREYEPENAEEAIRIIKEKVDVPNHVAREIVFEIDVESYSQEIGAKEDTIKNSFKNPILFLPTYRRIERDLAAIFSADPDPEERISKFRRRLRSKSRGESYLELVEFGMGDVQKMIEDTMTHLKDALRNDLDELTGDYLREVLREEYKNVNLKELRSIKEETVESMLSRTDEAVLPAKDKKNLRSTVSDIRTGTELEEDEKVVAHFLTKLLELHEEQGSREKSVRRFVDLCNQYVKGKRIKFDNTEFSLTVYDENESTNNSKIGLPKLSSGEKQIISLFAHLYLSSQDPYYVIIDEPELSLSMPWQKRFLPDILNTSQCAGLLAVTHSPFIFDNNLESSTHSIEEYKSQSV